MKTLFFHSKKPMKMKYLTFNNGLISWKRRLRHCGRTQMSTRPNILDVVLKFPILKNPDQMNLMFGNP
jgi:hypothetical protein